MKYKISALVALALTLQGGFPGAALSASNCTGDANSKEACAAEALWETANRITLNVSFREDDYKGSWIFDIAENRDWLVTVDVVRRAEKTKGQILLVAGRAMSTQGLALSAGYEIDALDGPVLMFRLVRHLLATAAPGGPRGVAGTERVEKAEKEQEIYVGTPSANGVFPAPWSVVGTLRRADGETLEYDFQFRYSIDGVSRKQSGLHLSGVWQRLASAPVFPDDMLLDSWSTHRIGPIKREREGGTILDYGAAPLKTRFGTLGELRTAIAGGQFDEKP